jgi:tetratricopeptide (TPR) repeat protein
VESSKLISLLKTFSAKELREFGDFVNSPFFNKNEEFTAFYAFLRKLAPDFPEKKIKREYVFSQLYPGMAYDDKKMNYLMSFVLKLAEQYLGYSGFTKNEVLEKYHVLGECVSRGLDKHYQFLFSQAQEKLGAHSYRNTEFYYLQHMLADIANQHFLRQKIRKYDDRLQVAADNFDQYFLAGKLKYCCEMLDRRSSIEAPYRLNMMEEVLAYVKAHPEVHTPPVALYHTVLQMILHGDEPEHFENLKQLLAKYSGQFPLGEFKDVYSFGINYCIRKVNQGAQQYLEELFGLYKNALESDLLIEDIFLSPWTYKNMIGVGLRLKEFDYTEQLIREYNVKLAPEFQDNALHYNLAELYYYKKDYTRALDNLNKVEFSDIYYNLDTKKMMLKIYFELEETDALYSLIASFRVFLRRTKLISEANKEAYQNFLMILNLLVKRDRRILPDIRMKIESTTPLGDRKWLKEACEKLERPKAAL